MDILFLHPPVAKPSEPPAGIAQLGGAMQLHNIDCHMVDLNIEGLFFLLESAQGKNDTWSRRAVKNRHRNLQALRSWNHYNNPSRYQKTVLELNRLLEVSGDEMVTAGLANYLDSSLSPLRSRDLLMIAAHPQKSIFYPFLQRRMEEILERFSPQYIGISLNYLSQALNTFALIGLLKILAPHIPVIVGGGLMTSWMRNPGWSNPFNGLINHCIDGCGVLALLQLFKTKEKRAALPSYSDLPLQNYLAPGFILPYSSSSGCFWNKCDFCPERAEGNIFQGKSPERVSEELATLRNQTKPTLLHFLDNAIPPAILKQLIHQPPGIPWYGFARVSQHMLDLDFCRALQQSGCVMLKLGIESADQRVLDQMEKGLDITTISRALKNLHKAGIATYVYLLFGTPAESYAEAKKTMSFVKAHHKQIQFLNLAIFNMPIIMREKETLQTSSFYGGDLSLYTDFHHPLDWDRKNVRRFLDQEFKRQPEIAAIIRRDPPIFTSNHAPFFCSQTEHFR